MDLSRRFNDRPLTPLNTAIYWTEYVIRHRGAPHLKTAAVNMHWYQNLLLDVVLFVMFVVLTTLAIMYYSAKLTLNLILNSIRGKLDKKMKNY